MAVTNIPNVQNWTVTPQNGQSGYFDLMNTWLGQSTLVIASLQSAITAQNLANAEINTLASQAESNAIIATGLANYQGEYSVSTTYSKGQSTSVGTLYYTSKVDGNSNHAVTDSAYWVANPINKKYDRGNILGAVSQTAGVPTGAIIETGSNANGRYTKFADGTMICTSNLLGSGFINIPMGYLFRTPVVVWIFPATFSGDHEYIAKNGAETAGVGSCYVARGDGSSETLASASFYFLRHSAVSAEPAGIFTAIGRWF